MFIVTGDFVRTCQNPILVMPDDVPAHPYAGAMVCAMLAPNAEVSMFPWKEPRERIPLAVRQIRSLPRAHRPASAQIAWARTSSWVSVVARLQSASLGRI